MYAAIRLIASLGALMVGWVSVVIGLMAVYWFSWSYLAGIEMLAGAISPPPPFLSLAVVSFVVPMVLLGIFLALFTVLPARWVMELLIRDTEHVRLPADHPLYQDTKMLADEFGLCMPAIYTYDNLAPNAWAFSTVVGSVVCVSLGLTKTLPQGQLRWVMAHELAHIKYFDAGTGAFWASSERVIALAWRVHRAVVNYTLRGVSATNMHILMVALMALPILIVSYTAISADFLSRKVFLLIDRWVGRAMEYRADTFAGRAVGAQLGIAVLETLSKGIEPSFGLFATHPTTPKRITRMQRLAVSLAGEATVESRV
ncbi:MAG: M48 family metallopeptidase [Pseudomonadales bacterium]